MPASGTLPEATATAAQMSDLQDCAVTRLYCLMLWSVFGAVVTVIINQYRLRVGPYSLCSSPGRGSDARTVPGSCGRWVGFTVLPIRVGENGGALAYLQPCPPHPGDHVQGLGTLGWVWQAPSGLCVALPLDMA